MNKSSQINREELQWILEQPADIQLSVLSNHLDICKAVINSVLQTAVAEKCGARYRHDEKPFTRWGYNPGSVCIGAQKIPVEVPRVVNAQTHQGEPVEMYQQLRHLPEQKEEVLRSVLHGISTRDYEQVVTRLFESFGLSASSISRNFVEESRKAVEHFCKRKFSDHTFVALFLDGKYLSAQQMLIALGITHKGEKILLSVIQSATENSAAIKQMLSDLTERDFKFNEGILCVIDGSKGIEKALKETWGQQAIIQRCQWHKRENVVSYLSEEKQKAFRKKMQDAYQENDYQEAKTKLMQVGSELKKINLHAHHSLMEGLEETLTIHRLKLEDGLRKSFTTTNCIESVNSHLVKYIHKVKRWMDSEQRYRWVVSGLLEIEPRLQRVKGHKQLHRLSDAIAQHIKSMNRISTNFET